VMVDQVVIKAEGVAGVTQEDVPVDTWRELTYTSVWPEAYPSLQGV
jgi:hypothetical protein